MNLLNKLFSFRSNKADISKSMLSNGDCCVIFDPKGTLTERYYTPKRGDQIINAFDSRCVLGWSASNEIDYSNELRASAQASSIGESMFPYPPTMSGGDKFFLDTCRGLSAHILKYYKPTDGSHFSSRMIAMWMDRARPEIDRRVLASQFETALNPGATPQRNAIMSTFTQIMESLRVVPDAIEGQDPWAIRNWAETRRGWLFFTQTPLTRPILQPWQNMMIDIIIRTLFDMGIRADLPTTWIVLEEAKLAGNIGLAPELMATGREYWIPTILSVQSRKQLDEIYGEKQAGAMISSPETQLYLKAGEKETANWHVDQMGTQRIIERQTTYSGGGFFDKRTKSVTMRERDRPTFISDDFTTLPNLQGFLRYHDFSCKLEIPLVDKIVRAKKFIPRDSDPVALREPAPVAVIEAMFAKHGWGGGRNSTEVTSTDGENANVTVTHVITPTEEAAANEPKAKRRVRVTSKRVEGGKKKKKIVSEFDANDEGENEHGPDDGDE